MRIDAHQHFWHYRPEEYEWIGPQMTALQRDYLPEDLAPLLAEAGYDGCVAVQARQTLAETEWLLALAHRYPFVKGVVGWADLCSAEVSEQLARLATDPLLRGVRHVVQDEPDPEFMLRADFQRGIGTLAEHGLTYDLLIHPQHLPAACALVERYPAQPFVLDHLAKPRIRLVEMEPWRTDLRRLAEAQNVCCKLSGIFAEVDSADWRPEQIWTYLEVVLEAFGPRRLMIGSDWPVCTLVGRYGQAMGVVTEFLERLDAPSREQVLGGAATRFYGLEG